MGFGFRIFGVPPFLLRAINRPDGSSAGKCRALGGEPPRIGGFPCVGAHILGKFQPEPAREPLSPLKTLRAAASERRLTLRQAYQTWSDFVVHISEIDKLIASCNNL